MCGSDNSRVQTCGRITNLQKVFRRSPKALCEAFGCPGTLLSTLTGMGPALVPLSFRLPMPALFRNRIQFLVKFRHARFCQKNNSGGISVHSASAPFSQLRGPQGQSAQKNLKDRDAHVNPEARPCCVKVQAVDQAVLASLHLSFRPRDDPNRLFEFSIVFPVRHGFLGPYKVGERVTPHALWSYSFRKSA